MVAPVSMEALRQEPGANLRKLRRAAGLRQEGLADVALVGRSSVANIEGGRQARHPRLLVPC
jgi:transcriptional regulator with XRE-family HTH domain